MSAREEEIRGRLTAWTFLSPSRIGNTVQLYADRGPFVHVSLPGDIPSAIAIEHAPADLGYLLARVAELEAHVASIIKATANGYREGLLDGAELVTADHTHEDADACLFCGLAAEIRGLAAGVCDDAALAVIERPGRRAAAAEIVAWLRDEAPDLLGGLRDVPEFLADAIERGAPFANPPALPTKE